MTSLTTAAASAAARTAPPRRASSVARVRSLARAEMLLLLRNRTTLSIAVGLAPASVGFLAWAMADAVAAGGGVGSGEGLARYVLTALAGVALLFVVYYNLTTTLVARREELVLKRLLTGEASPAEIVVACAVPAVAIVLAQLVLGTLAVAAWTGLPPVTDPLWPVVGVAAGLAVFVGLAVVSSGLTRTVESAQLTTMPVLLVATALSGVTVPLEMLPDVVQVVASWTPLRPVVALVEAGFGGGDPSLPGVGQPLLCLALWTVAGTAAARRWMRWEPRR